MLRLGAVDKDLDVPLYRSNYSVICRIHCFMDRAPSLIHMPTHAPKQPSIHPTICPSIYPSTLQTFPCEVP